VAVAGTVHTLMMAVGGEDRWLVGVARSYHAPEVSRAQGRAGSRASIPWGETGQEQRVSCRVVSCRTVAAVVVVAWVEAGPFDGGRLLDREREWVASGGPQRQALASLLADRRPRRRLHAALVRLIAARERRRAVAVWHQYPARATTSHLLRRCSHSAAAPPRQQPVSDSRKDATQDYTTATSYSRSRPSSRLALALPERTKASVCCSRGFLPVVVNRRSA